MGEYTDLIKILLGETVKYVLLLLFSVLAIRLWRRAPQFSGGRFWQNILLACLTTAIAGGVGYFSVRQSLGRLYLYYARRAFGLGHWPSSFTLYQTSAQNWRNADAVGGQGVCLLLLGNPREGVLLLHEAKALRHNLNTPFEQYYEGEFYFYQNQPDEAIPLLEASSADPVYYWNVARMLAIIALDRQQTADAQRLMKPFLQVPVQKGECDHAYIMVSLALLDGKTNEARAMLDEFPPGELNPFWQSRFAQLRAKTRN